jgi:hypothetical protein
MGCTRSQETSTQSDEEQLITSHEADLGFFCHSAQVVEAQIKRESSGGVVTLPKLRRLLASLRIDLYLDKPTSASARFFEGLKVNGDISTNRLVITGILLGTGTLRNKAQLMFDHVDIEAKGRLERREVACLLEEIMTVVVECLPVLAYTDLHETQLKSYQDTLSSNSKMQTQLALTTLMRSEHSIDQKRFVASLAKSELNCWLVPHELRKTLAKSMPSIRYGQDVNAKPFYFKQA